MVYLKTATNLLEVAANSFDAIANVYEITHGHLLDSQRLEEAYFLYKLILLYSSLNEALEVDQKDDSCRMDLESMCERGLEHLSLQSFIHHSCSVPGCSEGFIMADGIEKVHRKVCVAPATKLRLAKNMARIVSCCPNTPAHLSRFCSEHNEKEEPEAKKQKIILTVNFSDLTVSSKLVSYTSDIPSNTDTTVHVGCKKPSNVPRFTNRTAGILVFVKPCGVIVHWNELLTSESPSQLFVQLLKLKSDSGLTVNYFGYDRSCEVHPFLVNLAKKGNLGAEILLNGTEYVVDRFHIAGHTSEKCNIESDKCLYHPDLPKFKILEDVNTECAEQCFSWLGKYKNTLKYMSQYKYRFLIMNIIISRNENLIERMAKKPILNL